VRVARASLDCNWSGHEKERGVAIGKPRPNEDRYLEILRRMTPEQRIDKVSELTEAARDLLRIGLRAQHPELAESELKELYLARLAECHNRNY
jgi:hypothetical protein